MTGMLHIKKSLIRVLNLQDKMHRKITKIATANTLTSHCIFEPRPYTLGCAVSGFVLNCFTPGVKTSGKVFPQHDTCGHTAKTACQSFAEAIHPSKI